MTVQIIASRIDPRGLMLSAIARLHYGHHFPICKGGQESPTLPRRRAHQPVLHPGRAGSAPASTRAPLADWGSRRGVSQEPADRRPSRPNVRMRDFIRDNTRYGPRVFQQRVPPLTGQWGQVGFSVL